MKCKEITDVIEKSFPKGAALSFDHVGLQAGRENKEVHTVYIALDATESVINSAIEAEADMIVTHHPLIFSPLERVTDGDFIGRRVVKMIQNDISYYAMHTNYDVLGMADLAAEFMGLQDAEVLWETVPSDGDHETQGIGRVGQLENSMTLRECCEFVKSRLKLDTVKVFGDMERKISRLAISPGSGKDAVDPALEKGADVLVTGDIGHHSGIDAMEQGLAVIDAGHYGTEYIFIEDMERFFHENMPKIKVYTAPVSHPFQVV